MEDMDNEVILGGEKVSAKEEYLKTITNLFFKINTAAENKSLTDLQWIMNYYTDVLISAILNREVREAMSDAKESIYQVELIKKDTKKDGKVLTEQETSQAKVMACTKIVGECRSYFDRYFGFETKLSALV